MKRYRLTSSILFSCFLLYLAGCKDVYYTGVLKDEDIVGEWMLYSAPNNAKFDKSKKMRAIFYEDGTVALYDFPITGIEDYLEVSLITGWGKWKLHFQDETGMRQRWEISVQNANKEFLNANKDFSEDLTIITKEQDLFINSDWDGDSPIGFLFRKAGAAPAIRK